MLKVELNKIPVLWGEGLHGLGQWSCIFLVYLVYQCGRKIRQLSGLKVFPQERAVFIFKAAP